MHAGDCDLITDRRVCEKSIYVKTCKDICSVPKKRNLDAWKTGEVGCGDSTNNAT